MPRSREGPYTLQMVELDFAPPHFAVQCLLVLEETATTELPAVLKQASAPQTFEK